MADVTPEQRAEWRKDAEKHAPGSDPKRDRILSLLDALEATEQELRQRELHHFETEQMLADAEARVAAAVAGRDEVEAEFAAYRDKARARVDDVERDALERVDARLRADGWDQFADEYVVRDPMPRKDGE